MWTSHVYSSDLANATIGSKNYNRSKIRLKSSVKISEAFNIEHVNFVNKKNAWY